MQTLNGKDQYHLIIIRNYEALSSGKEQNNLKNNSKLKYLGVVISRYHRTSIDVLILANKVIHFDLVYVHVLL